MANCSDFAALAAQPSAAKTPANVPSASLANLVRRSNGFQLELPREGPHVLICIAAALLLLHAPPEMSAYEPHAARAAAWIAASQTDAGWVPSYAPPEPSVAWLWDQALALFVLQRTHPEAASRLVRAMLAAQGPRGAWADAYDPRTGEPLADAELVGSNGLAAFAMARYGVVSADAGATSAAMRAADWLAARQQADGRVCNPVIGNIATWWGFAATAHYNEARKLRRYLSGAALDRQRAVFRPQPEDRALICDANTLGAAWMRALGQDTLADQVLLMVRSHLLVRDAQGRPGFGSVGPVGLWYEGTAQYVAAGGPDRLGFLATVAAAQRDDGSVPHSDRAASSGLAWHTRASALAPTAWLYFAVEGTPFLLTQDERRGMARASVVRDQTR